MGYVYYWVGGKRDNGFGRLPWKVEHFGFETGLFELSERVAHSAQLNALREDKRSPGLNLERVLSRDRAAMFARPDNKASGMNGRAAYLAAN